MFCKNILDNTRKVAKSYEVFIGADAWWSEFFKIFVMMMRSTVIMNIN